MTGYISGYIFLKYALRAHREQFGGEQETSSDSLTEEGTNARRTPEEVNEARTKLEEMH